MKNRRNKYIKPIQKEVRKFQPWDFKFNYNLLRISLIQTRDFIKNLGTEANAPRLQKVKDMDRAILLLKYIVDDSFFHLAEEALGISWQPYEKDGVSILNFNLLWKKAIELENSYTDELFDILRHKSFTWWD